MARVPGSARSASRAVSPVVGTVLVVAIVVVLAGVAATFVTGLADEEEPAQNAVLTVGIDTDADTVLLTHDQGDTLHADETRLVWEIDGERLQSDPADAHTALSAGSSTTFTFDGTTSASGTWTGHGSPGNVDIEDGDTVRVEVYDTAANKPVFVEQLTADGSATLAGTDDGVSVSVDEYCAGTDVGENENENENENEDESGEYAYTYEYDYDYENGEYRYEYEYDYEWSPDAVQDPDPDPDPDPDDSLACVDPDDEPEPEPEPEPAPELP